MAFESATIKKYRAYVQEHVDIIATAIQKRDTREALNWYNEMLQLRKSKILEIRQPGILLSSMSMADGKVVYADTSPLRVLREQELVILEESLRDVHAQLQSAGWISSKTKAETLWPR